MRLTRFRVALLTFGLGVAALATVGLMLAHEPEFYHRAEVPAGPQRYETSHEFVVKDCFQFATTFADGKGGWDFTFTQDQLNSFFEEDFRFWGEDKKLAKIGISKPRIEFAENQIRLGFRYGFGSWSTVLSYDLKVWVVKSEMNVLAIEFQRRRAGALPIPTQQVFQELKELGRENNIEIDWYRHNGNPVAIVKFQRDRPRPTAQLQRLELGTGTLILRGKSFGPDQNQIDEPIKKGPAEAQVGS